VYLPPLLLYFMLSIFQSIFHLSLQYFFSYCFCRCLEKKLELVIVWLYNLCFYTVLAVTLRKSLKINEYNLSSGHVIHIILSILRHLGGSILAYLLPRISYIIFPKVCIYSPTRDSSGEPRLK